MTKNNNNKTTEQNTQGFKPLPEAPETPSLSLQSTAKSRIRVDNLASIRISFTTLSTSCRPPCRESGTKNGGKFSSSRWYVVPFEVGNFSENYIMGRSIQSLYRAVIHGLLRVPRVVGRIFVSAQLSKILSGITSSISQEIGTINLSKNANFIPPITVTTYYPKYMQYPKLALVTPPISRAGSLWGPLCFRTVLSYADSTRSPLIIYCIYALYFRNPSFYNWFMDIVDGHNILSSQWVWNNNISICTLKERKTFSTS